MSVAVKRKVKCTLVQALRLYTGRTAPRGSRGIALLFHDQRHQKGVRGQRHAPAALYPWERPGTHCTGGWVGPRAGLDRCGKSRPPPTGIRSPDRPERSQSLYRLSHPAHMSVAAFAKNCYLMSLRIFCSCYISRGSWLIIQNDIRM